MFIASVLCQKSECVVATSCKCSVSCYWDLSSLCFWIHYTEDCFPNIMVMDATSDLISFSFKYQGGGWCNNVTTCLARKNSRLGSSRQMVKQIAFSGILSNGQTFNPGMAFNNSLLFVKSSICIFLISFDFLNQSQIMIYCKTSVFLVINKTLLFVVIKHLQPIFQLKLQKLDTLPASDDNVSC